LSAFFLLMSLATLAGAFKHGLRHDLDVDVYTLILWISNVAGGAATWCAQLATLLSRGSGEWRRGLEALVQAQLAVFVAANALLGPEMLLMIAHSLLGLVPVIVVEARSVQPSRPQGGWVAAGLTLSIGTAAVYVGRLGVHPWLSHIDVAHLLLAVAFALIVRGAEPAPTAGCASSARRLTGVVRWT